MESVVSEFEKMVDLHPNEYALHTKDAGLITYRELNAQSNVIANAILALLGSGNDPVVLFYEHGEREQIEAILGVLKAGKIVVSINVNRQTKEWGQRGFVEHGFMDQSYVREILWMTGPELILTDHKYWHIGKQVSQGIRVLNTQADIRGQATNPHVSFKPTDTYCILHTTGTMGEPKAVKRPYSMDLYNMRIANYPHVGVGDRITLFRTANTAAMADTWFSLLNGARLCPFNLSASDITEWVVREKITYFRGLGTAFRMLDFERGEGFPHMRLINIGGEPITIEDVEAYRKYFPDTCKFVVRYSTSETGHISHYVIGKQTQLNDGVVPVGYPLGDRKITIFRPDRQGIGEIEVSDQCEHLFSGYVNQPKLMRDKLLSNGTLFRTGDNGYLDSNGALVHLGRKAL